MTATTGHPHTYRPADQQRARHVLLHDDRGRLTLAPAPAVAPPAGPLRGGPAGPRAGCDLGVTQGVVQVERALQDMTMTATPGRQR